VPIILKAKRVLCNIFNNKKERGLYMPLSEQHREGRNNGSCVLGRTLDKHGIVQEDRF
jgi:hypothetical protein